ncbi:MAG TPA: phytanoyl-CoA dioxygenase family protein, partial [Chthonomonadaceae bacterium]|nr:phytanoyl-CoA dioxygenase family protein [Chthonomonadaceae bacterium]
MPIRYRFLTEAQREQFLARGYIILHDCFPREVAERLTAHAFTRLGYDPDDPTTWKQARIHMPNVEFFPMETFAPKAWAAACELLGGEERVKPCHLSDGFIVNFHIRADQPWQPPSAQSPGWHKDGGFFRHFLDSPEQGLLTLVFWSDVAHQGGGTFVACDSVAPVARYLRDHPEGTILSEFNFGSLVQECRDFIEVTGRIGDIVLLHPYILHASSQNLSGKPRFLTNPPVALKEPMHFNRPDPSDYS